MTRNKKIQKLIEEVVEKIKTEYQPEKIILYGSYAYGKPNKDSDIDLFIVKDTEKRPVDRYIDVSTLIYERGRQISVEPLVYTPEEIARLLTTGDDFLEDVLNQGEVLYAR